MASNPKRSVCGWCDKIIIRTRLYGEARTVAGRAFAWATEAGGYYCVKRGDWHAERFAPQSEGGSNASE